METGPRSVVWYSTGRDATPEELEKINILKDAFKKANGGVEFDPDTAPKYLEIKE